MRVVVRLLDEAELLPLRLVQSTLHTVRLLQPLQRQDEQLRVVFIGERRERYGREAPTFQPMHRRGVDGYSLLSRDVWTVLQVVVLSLLLSLQIEPGKAAQILLTHRLVNLQETKPSPYSG